MASPNEDSLHAPKPNDNSTYICAEYLVVSLRISRFISNRNDTITTAVVCYSVNEVTEIPRY